MHATLPTVDPTPARVRGLTGWIARHPLAAFLAWLYTVGQAIAFVPVLTDPPVPDQLFLVATSVVGVFLPALAVTWVADGRDAALRFLRSLLRWHVALRWYLVAIAVVPLVAVGLAVLLLGAPPASSASVLLDALLAGFALSFLLTLVPNNWVEEAAWTGFAQARLQRTHAPAVAALAIAPLFALQHVSLAVGNWAALVLLAVLAVPFRMVTGWLWNSTGSLLLLGLLHAAGNAAGPGSGFTDGFLRRLYPDDASTAGLLHLLAFALVGLVVLVATRGRLGHPTARPPRSTT
ncbi:CPBP family glutamic-type intramembrane protease [Modestobacter versicolor]|uniref:CPBP family glutamic-type intramembrane protease n=1 Tax=Modestobacter versicolor TaxID=429133 RepID=UPI0034DE1641